MNRSIRIFSVLAGVLFALTGHASALIEMATGNVRAGATAASAAQVRKDQRIEAGTTVVTGPRSQAILRFDDGQAVALSENSELKVSEYSFSSSDPSKDKFVFDLFKGAMRSVTGVLTTRTRDAYSLRVPQATIGIRGTDFMVALVNPAYMSVLSGTIAASNSAGSVAFGAGATATVASATTLATTIAAAALPAAVASTFSELGSLTVTATAGAGAAGATGAATGGLTLGTVAAIGAVVAGVAAASSNKSDSPAGAATTGTTNTTSTR